VRWFPIAFALGSTGCLSIAVTGEGQTTGQTTGQTGGQTGGRTGGKSGGGNGGQSTGATNGAAPVPLCAPESHYVGDACVLDSCGPTSPRSPCLLSDGGVGICAAGNCLSTANDPSNCRGAGYVCPVGAQCFDGQCWGPGGSPPFDADDDNCPAGTTYVPGPICVLQTCGPNDDDLACAPGDDSFCCHGVCLRANDDDNCGGCGTTCPVGTVCSEPLGCIGAATCERGALPTPCELAGSLAGESGDGRAGLCCGAACVDLLWDSANCGGCDWSCPAGLQCDAGLCGGSSCDAGICPGDDACLGEGLGPLGGTSLMCVPNCPADGGDGQWCASDSASVGSCCGGRCVPVFWDHDNCGGCGVACAANEVCAGSSDPFFLYPNCIAVPGCSPGEPPCIIDGGLGSCCGTACVDFWNDSRNCGECGLGCPAEAICQGEECLTDAGMPAGDCGESTPCPAGEVCAGGHCTSRSCDGTSDFCALPGGERGTCCGAKCTDTGGDSDNCGSCGAICPAGSVCGNDGNGNCTLPDSSAPACPAVPCPAGAICAFNGSCVRLGDCSSASPGQPSCSLSLVKGGTCCNGLCTDLNEDPNNCGLCGIACPSGICAPYFENFRFADYVGIETSSCLPVGQSNDCLASCGPDTFCFLGACIPVSFGYGPCLAVDGTVGFSCPNGVCAHARDDSQNCGACGNACPPGVACVAGACAGSVCGIGRWGNFCGDAGERTCCPGADCTDTQTDSLNCGNCGWECPPGTRCDQGICG